MSCIFNRNPEGKVIEVLTPSGEKSELFSAIHNNVFLADVSTSVKILMNSYSPEILNRFEGAERNIYKNGEPILYLRSTNNKDYVSLEDLLLDDQSGKISMGFKDPKTDQFIPVVKIDTESSERAQFFASSIKEGVLSAERVLGEDGVTRMQGKGEYPETRLATARMFKMNSVVTLGEANIVIGKQGTIEFPANDDLVVAETADGYEIIRLIDVPVATQQKEYLNQVDLVIRYNSVHNNPRRVDKNIVKKTVDPKNIETSLYRFLESIGFEKTTLTEYRKNYSTRYGKDPDIQALADIANKVVAFQDGTIKLEDLSEEVAHIAIEAYNDQNSIVDVLSNVHLTPEYTEFSAFYRDKYAPFYAGVELEEQVRREILGKILAKEFTTQFSMQNKTADSQNVTSKLMDIWRSFVQYISSFLKSHHKVALEKINSKIFSSILNNDISEFQNPLTSNNFYYNAMSPKSKEIEQTLKASKRVVEDLFSRVLKQSVPNQAELGRITDKMNTINILSSINTVVGITTNQMSVLEVNIQEASARGELISQVDDGRYRVLDENLIPVLTRIKSEMSFMKGLDTNNKKLTDDLVSSIDELIRRKSNIDPLLNIDKEDYVRRIINNSLKDSNISPEDMENEVNKIDGNVRDLSWFGSKFGLITHSENPIMQLLGRKVIDMGTNVLRRFKVKADSELNSIYDKGLDKYQRSIIKKDSKGQKTFYFMSPVDWTKYNDDLALKENDVIKEITGKELDEILRLRKNFSPADIIGNEEKFNEYSKKVKEWKENDGVERRFSAAYYQQRDERFNKVGAADFTRETITNLNITEFNILKPYVNQNGSIDRSRLTNAEKIEVSNIRKEKEVIKSAYDQYGNLKEGLSRVKFSELTQNQISKLPYSIDDTFVGELTVLKEGYNIDDLGESARISLDMFNLNMLYRQELQDKTRERNPTQAFIDSIAELEERGETAYDWVMSNASISLTSDYFDNLGDFVGFDSVAKNFIDSIEDPGERSIKNSLLSQYKELQRARKDLIRQNKTISNPLETDVKNMMGTVKERLIDIDGEIDEVRRALEVPTEYYSMITQSTTPRSVNEAFEKMRIESGMSVFDFALKHMTRRNSVSVNDFALSVADIIEGKRQYTKKTYEDFIQQSIQNGTVRAGMTNVEITSALKDAYARSKVASYFQRFEPEGYTEVLAALQNGDIKLSDVISNKQDLIEEYPGLRYLEIVPDYTWTEDVNNAEFMNPNYKASGYYLKPRVDKYLDDEFFNRYGISKQQYLDLDTDDISRLTATKNLEEFDLLKRMIGLRKESLKNYGDQDVVNKYQLVQMSSKFFEKYARVKNIVNKGSIKDSIKDIFYNRKDEKVYGEQVDDENLMEIGSEVGVKIIPKYYQSKLEDAGALTENIIEAGLMDLKQSLIYSERKAVERDLKALEWKISQQRFLNNGGNDKKNRIFKRGEVSNYYDKAVEYTNHHLYGIQQTRHFETNILGKTVDMSRVVNWVQARVRFTNLGFNAFVDLTSATTGVLSNITDRFAGDFYHKSSANRANTQMLTMMGGYIAEAGKVNKKTKMNTLLEFFAIEDIDSRIKNSSFNRGLRLVEKSPYLLSKLANMPVTPKILLTILNDMRYSDGHFRSYNEFSVYKRNNNSDITKAEIDAAWNEIKNDSLYDNIDITQNSVKPNSKFKEKFQNPSEEFDNIHKNVVAKAKQVIQSADGVLNEFDQVSAQRDMLTNLFMMHRGWLLINLTKRFKRKHYNISTGQVEEGHYRTLANFLGKVISTTRNKESLRDYLKSLSPSERRNLKRFSVETSLMGLILLLGEAVLAGDDDDDTELENLAQLIYLRTTSEYNSSQLLGIPGSVIETAKSPIVALSTLESLEPLTLLKSIGEENSDGNSKFVEKVLKATVLKRYKQFSNLQKQVDSFRHFNDPTLFNLGEEKK